jgi:hypothetical protein
MLSIKPTTKASEIVRNNGIERLMRLDPDIVCVKNLAEPIRTVFLGGLQSSMESLAKIAQADLAQKRI